MAITNFIPEIWAAALLKQLRAKLVYAQAGIINRDYEGDIRQAGDTVHITSFDDPEVRTYSKYTPIQYDQLTDDTRALLIDQTKYWAITVDDVDKRQAKSGFLPEVTTGAANAIKRVADDYVANLMVAGVADGTGGLPNNQIGPETVSASDAYDLLVEFRTLLVRSETPDEGRFAIVPPEYYGLLLKDDRFIDYSKAGTTAGLRNGAVGRAAGFEIIEATTVPETSGGAFEVIAGHPSATTYADQLVETEALRSHDYFGDNVRGLHLYGAKVIRPAQLASATVTISGS